MCRGMNANYYVCVQLESVEGELSCSGPGPNGTERGMKAKIKDSERKGERGRPCTVQSGTLFS